MTEKSMAEFFAWDSGIVSGQGDIPEGAEFYTVLPEGYYYLRMNQRLSHLWPQWWAGHIGWGEDYPIYVPPEEMAFWRELTVACDPGMEQFSSTVRRPGYRLRGRPVTSEQAAEVIRRTRDLRYSVKEEEREADHVDCLHFDACRVDDGPPEKEFGWCRPDGRIRADGITQKYPNAWELVDEWGRLLTAFPFLDLMVLLWAVEEGTGSDQRQVMCGVHARGGRIELLAPGSAWRLFCRFERNYG